MPKDGELWRDLHRVLPQEHHHVKIKFEGSTNRPQRNEAHVMLPRCNKNGNLIIIILVNNKNFLMKVQIEFL